MAIEVFNGLGMLGAELKKAGFAVLGIDFKGCKDKPLCKTIWLDLTTRQGQLEFGDQIRGGRVKYVHFAPLCGTASAARNIRRSYIDPKPLRSAEFPEGQPDLRGTDKLRVEMANELYKFVAKAILKLEDMGISFSVENPTKSLMWQTIWFKEVLATIGNDKDTFHANWVHFQMCMHGGRRPRRTAFLYGGAIDLSTLEAACNHSPDEHLPWGLTHDNGVAFATALERNYPSAALQKGGKAGCHRCARQTAPKARFDH